MEFLRNNTRQAETGATVVSGASLAEAFKKVRRQFGDEAVISGSSTRTRRKSNGWGTEQVVEVVVETQGAVALENWEPHRTSNDLNTEIRYEVERLEKMVEDIIHPAAETGPVDDRGNPLGEFLVDNGASVGTVDRLLTRFASETGCRRNNRPEALAWLTTYLAAGSDDANPLKGKNAFLCEHENERLELVLAAARTLHEQGHKVLVLSVLPDPDRDVPFLEKMSADSGHDAAILRDPEQIGDLGEHLDRYESVLLDMPSLHHPAMAEHGPLHAWLAANTEFHRHIMVSLDRDFLDLGDLRDAARRWNGDCLVLTRVSGTGRPAKLLDLLDAIPLPVSVVSEAGRPDALPTSATSEMLLDLILAQNSPGTGGQTQALGPDK